MGSITIYLIVVISLGAVHSTNGAKILCVPLYHYSHVNFMGTAGSALRDAGHDVTLLVSNTFASARDKYNLKTIVFDVPKDAVLGDVLGSVATADIPEYERAYRAIMGVYHVQSTHCERLLGNQDVIDHIQREKFDLVIYDGTPFGHCFYTVAYKFDLLYMTINVHQDPWSLGVPVSAAFEPGLSSMSNNHMSFFERIQAVIMYCTFYMVMPLTFSTSYYVGKYAPEKPLVTAHSIYTKSEMFLLNHEIMCLDYPRVSMPHYQYIGGSSAKTPKPLSWDLETFVNGAEDGLIVLTFGSLAVMQKGIWESMKPKLIYAFERLPQRAVVLYALDDKVDDFPPNVMPMKWLPQNDLLGHPKARLFITHGGNNGQLEATYHGVPTLTFPYSDDQFYNGMRAETHNFGKMVMKWKEITPEELLVVLKELLANDIYSKSVRKCSKIIKSLPSAQEQMVHWVNHILEFGGSHLRPPSVGMPLYQIFMWDILLFIACLTVLVIIVGIFCCCWCIKKFCRRSSTKEKRA